MTREHMRLPLAVAILACLAVTEQATAQQPRATNRSGITVWQEPGFRGTSATFGSDIPDLSRLAFSRAISSLRTAPGETWQVCDRPNFRGRCQVFTGSVSNLDDTGWNDRIVSIRRVGISGGDVAPVPDEAANNRAVQACRTELARHGWTILSATTPTRNGARISLNAQVRG
ncbi:MAG TPA: beta/gamma crystallin-related protein, partial [Gemmatimonadaceae bacterium]